MGLDSPGPPRPKQWDRKEERHSPKCSGLPRIRGWAARGLPQPSPSLPRPHSLAYKKPRAGTKPPPRLREAKDLRLWGLLCCEGQGLPQARLSLGKQAAGGGEGGRTVTGSPISPQSAEAPISLPVPSGTGGLARPPPGHDDPATDHACSGDRYGSAGD